MRESKVEVLRGMREQRDRNPKVMKKKKNVCVYLQLVCVSLMSTYISVCMFSQ